MNKHTCTLPDGTVATRNSKGRTYSHVVAVRRSEEFARRRAEEPWSEADALSNFRYYQKQKSYEGWGSPSKVLFGREFSSPEEFLGCFPSLADFCEAAKDFALAEHETRVAAGEFEKFGAFSWSSRLDLAEKQRDTALHGRHYEGYYAEAVILEVQMTQTQPRKKKALDMGKVSN